MSESEAAWMRRGKLGRFLISIRRARGWQKRTMAKKLQLNVNLYDQLERGYWRPDEETLRAWIVVLELGEGNAGALCLGWVLWQDYSL